MTKLLIEIESCKQCPFFKEGPDESTDGFDRGNDWICQHNKTKGKIIGSFVEWHEVRKMEVPEWCPVKV